MDLHPLVVHFPIAMLFVWSVIEIVRPQKWIPAVSWGSVQVVMLGVGFFGALAALITGDIAAEGLQNEIVDVHETVAQITTFIYAVFVVDMALPFVLRVLVRILPEGLYAMCVRVARIVESIMQRSFVRRMGALLGVIFLTLTGMLGGAMVYGPNADPLTPYVLTLLGITL